MKQRKYSSHDPGFEKHLPGFLFLLLLASFLLVMAPVWADGDCKGHSCNDGGGDVNVNTTVSPGDVNVSVPTTNNVGVEGDSVSTSVSHSSRAYGFSHSLGNAAFGDCMGSQQVGTIIVSRQWNSLNKWCAAEVYDAKGLHKMAAIMRCDIKEIAEHFETKEECVDANQVTPQATSTSEDTFLLLSPLEAGLQAQSIMVAEQQAKIEELEMLVMKAQQAPRPVAAARPVAPQIIKQDFLNDEKRAKLRAIMAESAEEAQQ